MSYRRKHINPKIRRLKKKKFVFVKIIFCIFLCFIIITTLYFILFYPKFQVKKIDISGNKKVQSRDIENLAWLNVNRKIFTAGIINISSKSIFIIDTKSLIKALLSKFPNIEEIKAQKRLPDNLILKITERQPFIIFCNNKNPKECFFMDKNGIIFELLQNHPQNMIIVRKESAKTSNMGENIINKNIMDIISKVQKDLKDNFQVDINEVFVLDSLIFKTSENWQIYFDPTSDIDLQITKMNILLKDEIPVNDRKNIQYIYLQYEDRAYYK